MTEFSSEHFTEILLSYIFGSSVVKHGIQVITGAVSYMQLQTALFYFCNLSDFHMRRATEFIIAEKLIKNQMINFRGRPNFVKGATVGFSSLLSLL